MTDLSSRAEALIQETMNELIHRLNVIWRKWGNEDYPQDGGVGFRNEIFLFGDWMFYLLRNGCSENSENPNEWMQRNALTLLGLDSSDMMRCVGLANMHMTIFWCYFNIKNSDSGLGDDSYIQQLLASNGRQLDWIYNVHSLPETTARAAHQLLVDHLNNGDEFVTANKELLGMQLTKTGLGWCEGSSPEMWDRWATSAYMSSKNQLTEEPAKTEQFCEQFFSVE